jgi:hypothetical protein
MFEVLEKTGWTQVREKAPTNSVRAELFVPVVRETIDHPTTTFELPTGQGSNVVEISNYAIRPAYPEHRARYEQGQQILREIDEMNRDSEIVGILRHFWSFTVVGGALTAVVAVLNSALQLLPALELAEIATAFGASFNVGLPALLSNPATAIPTLAILTLVGFGMFFAFREIGEGAGRAIRETIDGID